MRAGHALQELVAHHAVDQVLARLEPEDGVARARPRRRSAASSVLTAAFMASAPLAVRAASAAALRSRRQHRALAERAGLGRLLGQRPLDGVAHQHPAALGARHGAAHQHEPALLVGLDDLEVQRGDAHVAHVAGHLLALEDLAGVLPLAGGAVAAVGDRHAVRGAQAARSSSASWRPGSPCPGWCAVTSTCWPLTKWSAVISAPTSIRLSGLTRNSASLRLGSTLATAKFPRSAPRDAARLAGARTQLQRGIAVLLVGAVRQHLDILHLQHGHGHVLACLREDAGHAHLLRYHSGTHVPLSSCPSGRPAADDAGVGPEILL